MPGNSEHEASGERAAREDLGLNQDVGDRTADELRLSKARAEMADWQAEQARAKSTEIAQGLADETREPAGTQTARDRELLANTQREAARVRNELETSASIHPDTPRPPAKPPTDRPLLEARDLSRPVEPEMPGPEKPADEA